MSYINEPYIEFYDKDPRFDSSEPYYPAILLWFSDSTIIHNSISPEEMVRYEDISDKSGFHSMWGSHHNDVRWIKASSTAKYYVEATFWVRYDDSSFSPNYVWLGTNLEQQRFDEETPETTVRVFCEEEKRFTGVVSQSISGSTKNMITTTAGTYAKITMRFIYSANSSNWSYPQLRAFVDSSANTGGIIGSLMYSTSGATKMYVYNRHLKIIKIV